MAIIHPYSTPMCNTSWGSQPHGDVLQQHSGWQLKFVSHRFNDMLDSEQTIVCLTWNWCMGMLSWCCDTSTIPCCQPFAQVWCSVMYLHACYKPLSLFSVTTWASLLDFVDLANAFLNSGFSCADQWGFMEIVIRHEQWHTSKLLINVVKHELGKWQEIGPFGLVIVHKEEVLLQTLGWQV